MSQNEAKEAQDSIAGIAETVFQTMLGMEIAPSEAQWTADPDAVVGLVRLTGAWNGAVVLETTKEQACEFAGAFLSCPAPKQVDGDVRDVIGELTNMIGGNLKSTMARGAALSPPQVTDGAAAVAGAADRQAFAAQNGLFWVSRVEEKLTQPDESAASDGLENPR